MDDITLEGLNKAGYKYYAFISYNHKDEAWAKGLQSRLRRYRLPSVARAELGADVRIDPVFRYKTNLPVAHLREQIKEELDRSKYLIVICSPNSAKPNIRGEHWVNDEVKRFIKLGRTNRIVPVIVDGVPNSGDDRECFCPALQETEISAVNLVEGSRLDRKHEFLRLVAKLLGLEPTQLIKEDEEDNRRDRIKKFLCRLPLIVLLAAGGLFAWDAFRPITRYYCDYVDCYGLPEGIQPVSEDEVGQHFRTYRFEYGGLYAGGIHAPALPRSLFGLCRKLRRVVCVDAFGRPSDEMLSHRVGRPSIQEFEYADEGGQMRLAKIVVRKRGGRDFLSGPVVKKVLFANRGAGKDLIANGSYRETYDDETQSYFSASMTTQRDNSDKPTEFARITDYFVTRDGKGRAKTLTYHAAPTMEPTCDSSGVYGLRYETREDGQVKSVECLASDGVARTADKYGVAVESRDFDLDGNVWSVRYADLDGNPILGREGAVKIERAFDGNRNVIEERMLNSKDELVYRQISDEDMANEMGGTSRRAMIRASYSNGCWIARASYRPDGRLLREQGEVAILRFGYDSFGDEVLRVCYDANTNKMMTSEGVSIVKMTRDRQTGDVVAWRYFGANGQPCCFKSGVAGANHRYDAAGNVICCEEIGLDGKLCCGSDGWAVLRMEYDKRNRQVGMCAFDAQSNLCASASLGGNVYCQRFRYDQFGNCCAASYYSDAAGTEPAEDKDGQTGWERRYDEYGRLCEYWNCVRGRAGDGETQRHSTGWRRVFERVRPGEEVLPGVTAEEGWHSQTTTWYSAPGRKNLVNGWCTRQEVFDQRGKEILRAFRDPDGRLIRATDDGVAFLRNGWNRQGRNAWCLYFDENGRPVLNTTQRVAGWIKEYDEETGRERRCVHVGLDGRTPTRVKEEDYSEIRYSRDGGVKEESYWHANRPVRCQLGYHRRRMVFNVFGKLLDDFYFDEAGDPAERIDSENFRYHHAHAEYDACQMMTLAESRDKNGDLYQPEGARFCVVRNVYDAQHRNVATFRLDKAGSPGVDDNGIYVFSNAYRKVSRTACRTDLYAPPGRTGVWGLENVNHIVRLYNEFGDEIEQSYWGIDGTAVIGKNNAHKSCWRYRRFGGMSLATDEFHVDADGHEVGGRYGAARIMTEYDSSGVKSRVDIYAPKGQGGVNDSPATHHVSFHYDADGNIIEQSYWDADGKPVCPTRDDAHRTVSRYVKVGDRSLLAERSYYDGSSNEVARTCEGVSGVARIKTAYGDSGTKIRCDYFAPRGKGGLCGNSQVHHEIRLYDDDERVIERSYRGVDDRPVAGDGSAQLVRKSYVKIGDVSRLAKEEYYDASDRATVDVLGVSRWVYSYDDKGRKTRADLYAKEGEGGVLQCAGVHHMTRVYDGQGNMTEEIAWGTDGRPAVGKDNAHRRCWTYETISGTSREVAEWYLDENGDEVADKNGIARVETVFDSDGVKTEVGIFAPKGRGGVWAHEKVHHVARLYDAQGNRTNECFRGADGRPVVGPDNAHRRCWTYETIAGKNRETAEWYLDVNGNEVADKNGIARVETVYDADGVKTEMGFFAPKGRGGIWGREKTHQVVLLFDVQGNRTNECFRGVDGEPVAGNNNAHRTCRKYETIAGKSREIAEWYLDENGHEMAESNGIARRETAYDARGAKTKVDFFAPKGRGGIWRHAKVHHAVRLFDTDGNATEVSFWGERGKPAASECQVHSTHYKYVQVGGKSLMSEVSYLDEAGNATTNREGVACRKVVHSPSGVQIRIDLFAPEGRGGVYGHKNVHHVIQRFDAEGNGLEQSYKDVNDRYTEGDDHIAQVFQRYEKVGGESRIVAEWHVDAHGRPATNNFGNVRAEVQYDESGAKRQQDWYAPEGRGGVFGVDAFHHFFEQYDAEGRVTAVFFENLAGEKFDPMVKVGQVAEGSTAAGLGIRAGDWICSVGDYDLIAAGGVADFNARFDKWRGKGGRIVFARQEQGGVSVFEVNLGPGNRSPGMTFNSSTYPSRSSAELIRKAYENSRAVVK